jgi:uridine phosphorylase
VAAVYRAAPVQFEPRHLRPAADLAERVLMPGDPHRALAVAQDLLDGPKMFNHARGLWGYSGVARDGEPLTIQSTGMGGPSAAIVCEELIAMGARRLVRIGTCETLVEGVQLGELLAAEVVLPGDGTSAALGADGTLRPDPGLLDRLVVAGARAVTLVSSDLYYNPRTGTAGDWVERGAVAVEMESAAILQVASRQGVRAASVVAGVGAYGPDSGRRLAPEQLEEMGLRLGAAGYAALTSP